MEILNHPALLVVAIILSTLSSVFLWRGIKEKDVPNLLFGVGTGIPPLDMRNFNVWLLGAGISFLGYWLRNKMDAA
jgi:hypothetical protein